MEDYDVLIIDDSIDDFELYEEMFAQRDDMLGVKGPVFHCRHAIDGNQGLVEIDKKLPHCVLLDYSLPGKNGLTILREIREKNADLPVVVMTGQGSERLAVNLLKAGAQDYLVKSEIENLDLGKVVTDSLQSKLGTQKTAKNDITSICILIVDDNMDDREFVSRALKKYSQVQYRFVEAGDGTEAMACMERYNPDCVLLDYSLPGEDGLSVLKLITESCPLTPVIMFTGQGSEYVAAEAIKNGAFHYLVKSELSAENLETSINQGLEKAWLKKTVSEKNREVRRYQYEALAKKQRFDRVVQATKIVVWEYDVESNKVLVDDTINMFSGHDFVFLRPDIEQMRSIVHPEDRFALDATWQACLSRARLEFDCVYRIRKENGSWHWIRETGKAVLSEKGQVIQVVGIYEDVNEKKREEDVVNTFYQLTIANDLSSEEKIAQILRLGASYLGVEVAIVSVIADDTYTVLYSQPDGMLAPGTRYDLAETYCSHVFGNSTVKSWCDAGSSELSTHLCYKNFALNTYIGTTLFIHGKAYGTLAFAMAEARDEAFSGAQENLVRLMGQWISSEIGDQLNYKKIEESEHFLRLVLDAIPDLIYVKDEKFRILRCNPAFLSHFPENIRDSIVGKTSLDYLDEDVAKALAEQDRIAIEEGSAESEDRILTPVGEHRVLHTKKISFKDAKGNNFILGISRDVTERREAEEEVLRSNQELERFAYVASHDLQEPLRMVINFTQLLEKRYADKLDERAIEYIRFASDGAFRMQQLVRDLLEYARIGNEAETHERVDLSFLQTFVSENLSDSIQQTGASISWPEMPVVFADPIRVGSIFQNIIGNAIKYRNKDLEPKIQIQVEQSSGFWVFSISDNGIGMKQEYCEKIFEPFKRLHRKEEYSGTGMGLSICRKAIEGFGGKIWAKSELGKGSTFYFTLPKAE